MSPAVTERVAQLILEVQAWAASRPDVRGVALVGSYARGTARPESDVDLVLLCAAPRDLSEDARWLERLGEVSRIEREAWGRVTSLRVYYADGLEVEFGVADAAWAAAPLDEGTRRVAQDGLIIVFDRGGAFAGLG